jgi:integrase
MNISSAPRLTLRRERYQQGSLTREKRSSGPDVWVYRWRESVNKRIIQRKRIIGTVQEYKTETAARKAVDALRLDINAEAVSASPMTVCELAKHYREKELGEGCGKTTLTRDVYKHHLDHYILPRWGDERIGDIKAFRVEAWLGTLEKSNATKGKVKVVFGVLCQHAMRYGWADRNPIRAVRQSVKRLKEPDILTPEELESIINGLSEPSRTLVITATVTGLRRGELIGLKWEDVDFQNGKIDVVRSLVDHVEGQPKTATSRRPVPLTPALASVLHSWKRQTSYSKPGDWVFASPYDLGAKPYWPDMLLRRHIHPVALAAGISKKIGWHTFRRTTATLLLSTGASIRVTQELLRHASPVMTLGVYSQAIAEDKMNAQAALASRLGIGQAEVQQAVV